jgi:zinc D-Ala-D-Ala carboxypeptidase
MITNRPLTKNFTLHELIMSQTGTRMNFTEQFSPDRTVVKNLEKLCENILQPLREGIRSSLSVSSGFRCPRVNRAIGGARRSQHLTGQAADIQDFKHGNEYLLRKILELNLPFDQVINEFGYQWVHVSFAHRNARRQILEAYKDRNNRTLYRTLVI